ncbi:MAG: sigma 54-interacting transcriptional regulator [Thermoguttaceae bacterium]|nr:sigma 54-interacting transcriptional regulator [Thermoguttaceae bacterium]
MTTTFANRADFVGATTTLRQACARLELAAGARVPFFFRGEPGVGKETLARAISEEPFAKLNCALLSESRWSELLGDAPISALFPNGSGTLYLTEADATPRATQLALARKLRAGWTNGRILLASSKSLDSDVWEPEFADALGAFPIEPPPLREREEDLAALANLFLREASSRLGIWPREITRDEFDRLRSASYPENLDDLRRAIDVLASSGELPKAFPPAEPEVPTDLATGRETFPSLDEAAIRHIEAALKLTSGVVEGKNGAAELLKINPRTLRSRMRKMSVDWTKFREERPPREPS